MVRFIFIVLFGIVFQLGSADAITRRPSRECLLCHVLWFDDFKTDAQTLLQEKESPIVIAGAVGLASSRKMCDSCHDGYVFDSRVKVIEGNPHHMLKKPPDGLKLPEDFRLDSNNEMYCGTCHTLHDISGGETVGSTPFLRRANERSEMCMACHTGKTEQQGSTNHPVLRKVNYVSSFEGDQRGAQFGPEGEIICQSCHNPHGRQALVAPLSNSTLCLICHPNQKYLSDTKHDLRTTLPEATNVKQKRAVDSGPCGACHIPHNGIGKRLWARRLEPGDLATQMCLSCHGEKSGYQIKRIGNFSHPTNVEPVSNAETPPKLPLYSNGLFKQARGRVQCPTCHDVHRWAPAAVAANDAENAEGDASNSFLRLSNLSSSALCIECHIDNKQLITSDHNLKVTAPDETNILGFTAGVSGPCGACHVPHNAAGPRLWGRPTSGDQDFFSQLCTGCHNPSGAAQAKLIGENYHPVNVAFKRSTLTGAEEFSDPSLPLYDQDGNRKPNEKVVCMTCHEPHIWNPEKSGALSNYAFTNMEGDAADSFLRKPNSPSSDLCKDCHSGKVLVDGTVHDLNVSAPEATNLLGQTVKASGLCGACHLVHNSPNPLKIWARPFGPIAENESPSSALCTSCHSKGNIAENKIPRIATHPEGKLLNNILHFNREKRNYTLIFDKYGKEVNFGNIACPSCHNAHKWRYEEVITEDNPEGQPRGRFLRVKVHNVICIDCHGPDALFRYQYFHDPVKRAEILKK
jgi:predicted CXXCH cytochrome family protein